MSVLETGLPVVAMIVLAFVWFIIGWHRAVEREREAVALVVDGAEKPEPCDCQGCRIRRQARGYCDCSRCTPAPPEQVEL